VAPFSSTLIWQHKQPSAKVWHIWLQALHSTFGTQLIIAIPLGGWLRPPHQPTVYIPYDPASDLLYQPGHHQVWQVFTKLPNALVTNSSHNTHTFMLLPQSKHGLPHLPLHLLAQLKHFTFKVPVPCPFLPHRLRLCQNLLPTSFGRSVPSH